MSCILTFGIMPLAGCVQMPTDKSVHDLRPVAPTAQSAKSQELSVADISKSWLQQADLDEKTGKTAEAIAVYQKMRTGDGPDAPLATRKLAILYYRTGDLDKAEKEFQLLKLRNPKDAVTLTYLGDINYQRGMWSAAAKYYDDALYHQPKHDPASIGLGMTLAQTEAYGEAITKLSQVVPKAEAYCCVARVMTQQGKRQDAIRAYETALQLDPNVPQARSELTRLQQSTTTTVTRTTHLTAERRGTAELMDAPPVTGEGANRTLVLPPTLPPLPERMSEPDWATGNGRK